MIKNCLFLLVLMSTLLSAQERFPSGEFKGFTKSPTEHIISRVEQPIVVTSITGNIFLDEHETALEEVLFEIRGPGTSPEIRAAKTDAKGWFAIKKVPKGTYVFKATLLGFQSLVGSITVSPKASSNGHLRLQMRPGV